MKLSKSGELRKNSRENDENTVETDNINIIAENRFEISNKPQERNNDSLLDERHIVVLEENNKTNVDITNRQKEINDLIKARLERTTATLFATLKMLISGNLYKKGKRE